MSKELRDESTEGAKEIWEAVDRAANNAPEWLKEEYVDEQHLSNEQLCFLCNLIPRKRLDHTMCIGYGNCAKWRKEEIMCAFKNDTNIRRIIKELTDKIIECE